MIEGYWELQANSKNRARDYRILFQSQKIHYTEFPHSTGAIFLISPELEDQARHEVFLFHQENKNWPPAQILPPKVPKLSLSMVWFHFIVLCGLSYFQWTISHSFQMVRWYSRGRANADLILAGEWGRTVTALTLHGSSSHLMGNFLALFLFLNGVSHFTGLGIAWVAALLSGATGNFLNALFYQQMHNSIGASTSVFGLVGVIGVMSVKLYLIRKLSGWRSLVPLIASLGLLAMLGTSPESDVMAHFFGFLSGLGYGVLCLPFVSHQPPKISIFQVILLVVCSAVLMFSWQTQLCSGFCGW